MNALVVLAVLLGSLVTVRVDTNPAHHVNTVRPQRAIGAGIDSDPPGKIALLYSAPRTRAMLASGLGNISYRLYTELSIEDWHWNPAGTFSDPLRQAGYWTSSDRPDAATITDSWGYRLPHRGSTRDQGDDNDYSRIDDGDPATYWKSDPYLAPAFTHDPPELHPQWAVIDFGGIRAVNAVRIAWANPYAKQYRIQYWTGADAILDQGHGAWIDFSRGPVAADGPAPVVVRVARSAVHARFFRLLMRDSSSTCDTHGSTDPRNCVGFAIRELALGRVDAAGRFHDRIVHSTCGGNPTTTRRYRVHQTTIFVSSVDPWHRASDRIPLSEGQDQAGLDLISRSPLTRGLPVMYPVPMLYSTPANAVAEIRYLRARGYPIQYVEMGEEADGQYVDPEDYAALYLQFARAIHRVDPTIALGGPIFEGVNSDVAAWPNRAGDTSFLHRFIDYLRTHHGLAQLAFMSYEHYPYKGCDRGAVLRADLLGEAALVRKMADVWRHDGLPAGVPQFITEGNFAADGGPVPQTIEGALWWADYIGSALSAGVSRIYHYQYEAEPLGLKPECHALGSYGMFIVHDDERIRAQAAQFYAARLLTTQWLEPGDRAQRLFPVTTSLGAYLPAVSAYAAQRPDGTWSILLVNKDRIAHRIRINLGKHTLRGWLDVVTFGRRQYDWSGRPNGAVPRPNAGPHHARRDARELVAAPESIVVVRTRIAP